MNTMILFILFLVLAPYTLAQSFQNFDQFQEWNFKLLMNYKYQIENAISKEGTQCDEIKKCDGKIIDMCQGIDDPICPQNYLKYKSCDLASKQIQLSPGFKFSPNVNIKTLTPKQKEVVCLFNSLKDEFKKDFPKPNSTFYIGTEGVLGLYPAQKWAYQNGRCSQYDPTTRQWFIKAATHKKKIVIIVQNNQEMEDLNYTLKLALNITISDLNQNDYASIIISNNNNPKSLYLNTMSKANKQFRKNIFQQIQKITFYGGKQNLDATFKLAMDHLESTSDICEEGENVILLLSNGKFKNQAQIYTILNQSKVKPTVFSYAFANSVPNTNFNILNRLSCAYNGIVLEIPMNTAQPFTIRKNIRKFSDYFTLSVYNDMPKLTGPYDDALTIGKIMTYSIPIYKTLPNGLKQFYAIIALDISIDHVKQFFLYNEDKIKAVGKEGCRQRKVNICDLQKLRQGSSCPKKCPINQLTIKKQLCSPQTPLVTHTPQFKDTDCCNKNPSTSTLKKYIIIPIVVGILLLVLAFFIRRRCIKQKPIEQSISDNNYNLNKQQNKEKKSNIGMKQGGESVSIRSQNPLTQFSINVEPKIINQEQKN